MWRNRSSMSTGSKARTTRRAERSGVDYQTLADLRYHIRRFLRVRESVARAAGVEPQHYLLLLQIKGLEGRNRATVGHLAERLQLRHHSTVELVNRLAERGLVTRRRDGQDRREVVVTLRPAGERILRRLAAHSVAELQAGGPALLAALTRLIGRRGPKARRRER
jgi:DNA-binding MarR family transcriptional regulator